MWRDVATARAAEHDDGSDLKTNGSAAFPAFYAAELADADAKSDGKKKELLKDKKAVFDALAAGEPAVFDADVANSCQKKWFAEIMKHHYQPRLLESFTQPWSTLRMRKRRKPFSSAPCGTLVFTRPNRS